MASAPGYVEAVPEIGALHVYAPNPHLAYSSNLPTTNNGKRRIHLLYISINLLFLYNIVSV